MRTILQSIWLFIQSYLGLNLKLSKAGPEFPVDDGFVTIPDAPNPKPAIVPVAPQIIIPTPENVDDYGQASSIVRAMKRNGLEVFDKDSKDYNLNIVEIRNTDPEFDKFNCSRVMFWKFEGEWQFRETPVTTYPGDYYTRVRLLNPKGVAILAPGQQTGAYKLGSHRGKYQALCQLGGAVPVYRDGNRDRIYDMEPATIMTGWYGINRHATENPDDGISVSMPEKIASASAGCIVNARVQDFVEDREIWRDASENWGNSFSPSLILDTDLDDIGTVKLEPVTPQIDEKQDWIPSGNYTGIRNRNLLNVKQNPGDPWKHTVSVDSRGHVVFPSFAKGVRAGIIDLRSKYLKRGLTNLQSIMERYAPSSDTIGSIAGNAANNPGAYARFVANKAGVSPNESLGLFQTNGMPLNRDRLYKVVRAMIQYENAPSVELPRSVFEEALALV